MSPSHVTNPTVEVETVPSSRHTPPWCGGENWQPIVAEGDGILLGFKHPSNLIVFRAAYHEETATAYIDLCESGDGYDEDGLIPFLCSVPSIVTQRNELLEALTWAMAELRGKTRYDNPQQATNCFELADAAIAKATGAA